MSSKLALPVTGPAFSSSYRRYVLAVLTSVYLLNLLDRILMGLLLEPIKHELALSDTQLGFLTGIAFGLFYATLGLPIARWADRGNRVTITSLSIGLWGLTVMACFFVTNFIQLVLARMLAAVGEAGCMPPTYSLLGDYFAEARERARAMAIYMSGSALAAVVGFTVGGWLNEAYGWRMAFVAIGVLGLMMAVLVRLTLVEPRTHEQITRLEPRSLPPVREVLTVLWTQRSARHLSIALVLLFTLGQGLSPWYAAFMMRVHAVGTAELGVWFSLIFGVGGTAGALLGGYLASNVLRGDERKQMVLSAWMIASLVLFFVAFLMAPQKAQSLAALVPCAILFGVFLGPVFALMQRLVADDMRATTTAVVMLLANLIGMGLGPQAVGVLSDLLAPLVGIDSLRYAMLIMSFLALWVAYHFWQAARTVREDLSIVGALPGQAVKGHIAA